MIASLRDIERIGRRRAWRCSGSAPSDSRSRAFSAAARCRTSSSRTSSTATSPASASTGCPRRSSWTESIDDVLPSDVDIVIELVGGLRPTYDWVRRRAARRQVGRDRQQAADGAPRHRAARSGARRSGLEVRFEASVAGGIPVLRALQEGLAGDRLVEVRGILNGTCAYILSRMQSETDVVRRRARRSAEGRLRRGRSDRGRRRRRRRRQAGDHRGRRPAPAGARRPTSRRDRSVRSSRSISSTRASSAARSGRSRARRPRTTARCSPPCARRSCRSSSSFGRIEGSQNLVTVRGVFGGETSFFGSGAGGSPTAVAVVSDVLSVGARAGERAARAAAAPTAFHQVSGDFVAPHYVRFTVNDKPGILAQVTAAYAQLRHQHRRRAAAAEVPQGSAAVRDDARGVLRVGARPRARRRGAERLPRAAAAGAADLLR